MSLSFEHSFIFESGSSYSMFFIHSRKSFPKKRKQTPQIESCKIMHLPPSLGGGERFYKRSRQQKGAHPRVSAPRCTLPKKTCRNSNIKCRITSPPVGGRMGGPTRQCFRVRSCQIYGESRCRFKIRCDKTMVMIK